MTAAMAQVPVPTAIMTGPFAPERARIAASPFSLFVNGDFTLHEFRMSLSVGHF